MVTLNGDAVSVVVSDSGVKVNDAMVTKADVIASNGIIHVIDTVLMPPEPVTSPPTHAPTVSLSVISLISTQKIVLTSSLCNQIGKGGQKWESAKGGKGWEERLDIYLLLNINAEDLLSNMFVDVTISEVLTKSSLAFFNFQVQAGLRKSVKVNLHLERLEDQ